MGDSVEFEVLSFEEIEEMKKEYSLLSNRVEAVRRKLALESKLRDAAQSLNRLYSTKGRRESGEVGPDGSPKSPRKQRRSFLGGKSSGSDTLSRTDDELLASTRKCEELAQELWKLENRADDLQKRILEHTAGILQMTHKGFKKNGGRELLSVSPESLRGSSNYDGEDDFDDRSLYKTPDHLDEYGGGYSKRGKSPDPSSRATDIKAIEDTEKRLEDLNNRLREMILQANPNQPLDPVPSPMSNGALPQPGATLQAHLDYLENSLEAMDSSQTKALQHAERSIYDTEERLEDLNIQIHNLLRKSSSGSSPMVPGPPNSSGNSLQAQLSYLSSGLDNLKRRVEGFNEQRTILTTQIQQQRELNTKSDAERDSQIADLTLELSRTKKTLATTEIEARGTRDELVLVMEQLDAARQESTLREQQRGMDESNALKAEKEARRKAEDDLFGELKLKQEDISCLEMSLTQLRSDAESQSQQLRDAEEAASLAEQDQTRIQAEMKDLEGEVVRAQTELTVVRAELDGAYGTRAQRAADGAGLQERVEMLQKELRETIEDYELMTKASIEFEKERDNLESMIDGLRERCETLEAQLSDEKVRWLGMKSPGAMRREGGASETTSTMVLKNEFKKMMRDTRAENLKALRVSLEHPKFVSIDNVCLQAEQEERRRLEALVRSLRKERQPSKSSLSQSMSVS